MAIEPTFIYKTFDVALELKQTSTNPTFSVIEGDTGNRLHITVTDGGSAVDLTGCRVIAVFSKSNGISMQDNCVANNGITIGGTNNNEVTVDLFLSSLAPGNVECELQIYSGLMEVLITTARFNFVCRRGIMNEDVLLSTNEYPLLIELIATVEGFVDVEAARVLAEQARERNEANRNEAEATRVSNENARIENENLRKGAENQRDTAETAREQGFTKWQNADATATTLPEGSTATATVTEVDGHKRFAFGIPAGPAGGATNLVDGSTEGSLRSISSVEESNGYTMGKHAVALGYLSRASGQAACAEGTSTTASGESAHAEGNLTTASGYRAHSEGLFTIAAGHEQHVQGKYNIEDNRNQYAHIVGNGTGNSKRSNAHTVDWDGNAWFAGHIKVGGTGWDDATDEVAYKSDLEGLGGVSDNDILAALIETDSLPAITTTAGAILTDSNGNIIIRY